MQHLITRASFNLTRNCNLRCKYPCFTNGCTIGDMPEEIAYRGVDFLINNALASGERQIEISFWGGEPLLKWELLKKVTLYAEEETRRHNLQVQFGGTTNGTLLTPEKFDFLDAHKIFFMVSFDGTADTHDKYRVTVNDTGSHEMVRRNMVEVLKKWPFYRARVAPTADNAFRFYEDVKYLFDLGFNYIMFSPVYESEWTFWDWATFESECRRVIDLMISLKLQGRDVEIEHFKSYQKADDSKWPCGAGRNYVGIDIDGAIYPCHRFNKFDDNRPWQEKEVCIGHIDHGITNPEFRQKFIDFHPQCGECDRLQDTPCHGGCYALNYDFTKDITKHHEGLCNYVDLQKRISSYYAEQLEKNGLFRPQRPSQMDCVCNFTYYNGPVDPKLLPPNIALDTVALLLTDLNNRVSRLEATIK